MSRRRLSLPAAIQACLFGLDGVLTRRAKPHAAAWKRAFEDALAGVHAGRAGGFGLVVGVDRGGGAERLRAHGAGLVVDDLGDLVAP